MKNPSGICMCGCGEPAPVAKESRRGYKRGEYLMFRRGHSSKKLTPEYVIDGNGCWIWQRSLTTHGYGHFGRGGRDYLAHRVYYERANGPIAKGLELHHGCAQRACVNPAHLILLTRRTHMLAEGRKAFGRYPIKADAETGSPA